MENKDDIPSAAVPFASPASAGELTVVTHARELHMYRVTIDELDALQSAGDDKTLSLGMLGIASSVFSSLLVTLLTVDIPPGRTYMTFVAVCGVSGFATLFFAVSSYLSWRKAKNLTRKITTAR